MAEKMSKIQIWQGKNGIVLPANIKSPIEIVPFAVNLTDKQKSQLIAAFQIDAYDMAAEYAWKKAMVKLKETLATLGMKFIGEMIGKDDFDDTTSIDSELTDFTAIQLAGQLGVIDSTGTLKLRQCNELISHYFSKNVENELDYGTAFTVVKSSVEYILGEQDISIAIEFSKFRERLLGETLKISDNQVEQIIDSPLFYLRTVISILLSSIRNDIGAKLEHSLANLNLLLPHIWTNLGESDKWNLGTAYRDVTAAGNMISASGLKNALLKVNGFDYVPENLRSATFIKTAKQVLETHFASNNFYNEPAIVKKLSSLGTTIPAPALVECMQAYLAVYLGNSWGRSWGAINCAYEELSKISSDRWLYYFMKVLHNDEIVLSKTNSNQVKLLSDLLVNNNLADFQNLPKQNQTFYDAVIKNNAKVAYQISQELLLKMES